MRMTRDATPLTFFHVRSVVAIRVFANRVPSVMQARSPNEMPAVRKMSEKPGAMRGRLLPRREPADSTGVLRTSRRRRRGRSPLRLTSTVITSGEINRRYRRSGEHSGYPIRAWFVLNQSENGRGVEQVFGFLHHVLFSRAASVLRSLRSSSLILRPLSN